MGDLFDRIMKLWTSLPAEDTAALAAFREFYTDPVRVNGATMATGDLLARARALHTAFDGLHHELLKETATEDGLVVVFRMRGTHTGTLATPLGDVPPTGRAVDVLTVDVLTLTDGKVSGIWVVADQLGQLTQLGAVGLGGG